MSRPTVIGSIAVALTTAVLLFAGIAFAASPKKNARFGGNTSAPAVEGFRAPVKFTVAPDGKSLLNFTFGTFGCFGAGGFRPGVNPYTGNSLVNAGKVKVGANGKVSAKTLSGYTVAGQKTTTTISIDAKFSSPKRVSGTISFSQVVSPGGAKCGPANLSFTASAA
jgi:hypothetical protein